MKKQLGIYLNKYAFFAQGEIDLIYNSCFHKVYKKKEFLLKSEEVCTYKFFVGKGLVRQYILKENGNEKIQGFALENWWITNLDSFINESPSVSAIQAIEETTVLQISKKDIENLYIQLPKLERVFRIISEKMIIALQRRHDVYMDQSSSDRYTTFINQIPHFAQRVPQYMIASYLDITPEYLSEIRKTI